MARKMLTVTQSLVQLSKLDKSLFDIPVSTQREYIESLGGAKDDFDRSFKQYQCQIFFSPKWKTFALNIIGAISIPFFLVYFRFQNLFVKRKEKVDAIGDYKGMEEIIPEVLNEEFQINLDYWGKTHGSLAHNDALLALRLCLKYPLSPFFCAKCIIKLAKYSTFNKSYSPSAIIVHGEYSFTSSFLTFWCENNRILHINVMHGEKLFYIRDSYFRFSRCYIWDKYYAYLFGEMNADQKQFMVAIPPSMRINTEKCYAIEKAVDYKYFMALENKASIQIISEVVQKIVSAGHSIMVRPHPRYTDMSLVKGCIEEKLIENPFEVPVYESIANTSNVIGVYSTIMTQAFYAGKGIIIDDITDPERFSQLQEMEYHLLNEENIKRLSIILDTI